MNGIPCLGPGALHLVSRFTLLDASTSMGLSRQLQTCPSCVAQLWLLQVEKVAAVYGSQDGLWFESSRAKQGLFPTVKVGPAPALAPAMAPATSVSTAGRR